MAVDGDHFGAGQGRIRGQASNLVSPDLGRRTAGRDTLNVARGKPRLADGEDAPEPGELVARDRFAALGRVDFAPIWHRRGIRSWADRGIQRIDRIAGDSERVRRLGRDDGPAQRRGGDLAVGQGIVDAGEAPPKDGALADLHSRADEWREQKGVDQLEQGIGAVVMSSIPSASHSDRLVGNPLSANVRFTPVERTIAVPEFSDLEPAWLAVASAYGLGVIQSAVHVATGDEASVWRAETKRGPVCLKILRSDRDTADFERRAILMERLRSAGLPFPRLLENANGGVLTTVGPDTVAMWAWSNGSVPPSFNCASAGSAARLLAKLHRALLHQPHHPSGRDDPPRWLVEPAAVAAHTCSTLLDAISRLKRLHPVDLRYQTALRERVDDLLRVDALRRTMPPLASQLVHHDYTRPNLLFDRDGVVAVLDLKGHVGPPIWELGKIAFEPQTVVRSANWLEVACAAAAEYCVEEAGASSVVWSCARAVVLYNMFSFWGPWQRYVEGIRATQDGMDDYWLNRHAIARLLLANLGVVEGLLADAGASPA